MADKLKRGVVLGGILIAVTILIPGLAWVISLVFDPNFMESIAIMEAVGTIGLSAILAYLYFTIRDLQERQGDLMKAEYEPEIKTTISSGNDGYPVVLVRNTGFAAALEADIQLAIGDKIRESHHPFLSSGDSIEYPLYEKLSHGEIIERIEQDPDEAPARYGPDLENLDDSLRCKIVCEDVIGDEHSFEEVFEITSELSKLEDYQIRTEVDALETISSDLNEIRDEIQEANNDLL